MINNNTIDKNGTLALTSDLIQGPLCTHDVFNIIIMLEYTWFEK